ncbi:glycoside hydrolase family 9 protein [Leptothoe spongobia]|uniref:Glycoside hydrolase family 9 protein n=1 Tax=Leptothoe spongobia TAU-MAC 1115 TaxID=1967444 RepID=A0A947DCB6_9CYAN|nr:glycoside hydrolase family 9 protein [Leptothoe spongobia]MBT9314378.1 glycoside hydrolase family 9 protein [Leptothoe spongobia TAU-MAC 1115]
MLESFLSFLLSLTTVGQCNAGPSSSQTSSITNLTSLTNARGAGIPVTHIYTVSENVMALRIETGELVRGKQVPYEAEPKDIVKKDNWVKRSGKIIGQLIPSAPDRIWQVDQIIGPKLNLKCVDHLGHYKIITSNGTKITPTNIYRKSNIRGMARTGTWHFDWPMVHTIFLEMPEPLTPGETYKFNFAGNALQDHEFIYQPDQTRSEAVQVSHLGFDPDDPAKVAFLSTWMGAGGGLTYPEGKPFWLINADTGENVYEGKTTLSQSVNTKDLRERNHNDTDVFIMDFSQFSTPGQYRVYVDGVGTSYDFEIGENTWRDAFYVSARGMYHQRSGIALEQPYTDYQRPRSFHPDDGVKVYRSTIPLMETNMGFHFENTVNAFDALVETRTDELLPNAWGGWMDAGDWDRRIGHLEVTRSFLELVDLYPDYFKSVNLNLPESGNNLPDILDEALWGLDVFRRLQTEEGSIPGGIESAGHPLGYEGSWQESQMIMAYGPGIWSSYIYANVAARAAYVLNQYDKTLAQTYQDSAIRAMNWANAELAKDPDDRDSWIYNERNLAAAELYRLTGDNQWHQLFLDTTVFKDADTPIATWKQHDHRHAAFVYARTQQPTVNQTIQQNAIKAMVRDAHADIKNIEFSGYKWNINPQLRIGWGLIGAPKTQSLFRAHALTGKREFLRAGILATQYSAGANPNNMVHTTGIGYRNPNMILVKDARVSGQAPPPGITVYGPVDMQVPDGYADRWAWAIDLFAEQVNPNPYEWPTSEAYFDAYNFIPVVEFTVQQSIGPTAYAWGYIAASDKN